MTQERSRRKALVIWLGRMKISRSLLTWHRSLLYFKIRLGPPDHGHLRALK